MRIVNNMPLVAILQAIITTLLLLLMSFDAIAESQTFYYKATASATPTGAGKVYLGTSDDNNPTYYESVDLGTKSKSESGTTKPTSTTVTFYLKAKADSEQYNLVTWKRGSTQIRQAVLINGEDAFSEVRTINSTTESSPTSVAYTANFSTTWVTAACDGVNCQSVSVSPLLNSKNTNVTLTAVLAPGFYVKYWINKNTGEIVEASRQDASRGNNPWKFKVEEQATYEPVLGESWITASSSDSGKGTVVVSPSDNLEGDEVTLLAVPKSGFYDIEWRKKGDSHVVSTDNPLRLTATEKVEYVATFVAGKNVLTDGFYRVYSPNPSTTKSNIALVDNLFDMHKIVGSVSSFLNNPAPAIGRAQTQLAQDINLLSPTEVPTLVNSVVYLKKVGNQYDFYAQGTHIKELSKGAFYGNSAGKVSSAGGYLDLARAGDCYLMSLTIPAYAEDYRTNENMGPFYFSDRDGKFSVLEQQDEHCLWVIEPMDVNENFFAVQPQEELCVGGRYYTTLRTPFDYQIPEGSNLKAYGVTDMPNEENGVATLHTYGAGDVVPAGMPVVIETPSLQVEDNKLIPCGDPTDAISTNSAYSVTTALYNNYGSHRHDNARKLAKAGYVDDIPMTGDQVGYFIVNPDYTDNLPAPVCYELGVNENGVLGFWNQIPASTKKVSNTTISYYALDGTKAYSTKRCALFDAPGITLADLIASGDTENTYNITDLTAVALVDNDRLLICKDDNGYAGKDIIQTGWYDYVNTSGGFNFDVVTTDDQSNWIALRLNGQVGAGLLLKKLTSVRGRLVNTVNPEFQLDGNLTYSDANQVALNTYVAASFSGENHQQGIDGRTYFFVQPKPMEYAQIDWAQWDGEKFIAPIHDASHPGWNQAELVGQFDFNDSYLEEPSDKDDLRLNHAYQMAGLIRLNEAGGNSPAGRTSRRADAASASKYVVYPTWLSRTTDERDGIITAVTALAARRNVADVYYINLAGQQSSRPWSGVNMVVTRYTDGTTTTSKVITK